MKIRKKDGTFKEIIYNDKQLYQYGLNKLSSREYGREELKTKMLNLQPDVSIVNVVLDKLIALGYLSNERRIQSIINQYSSKESLKKTMFRLSQKGFTKEELNEFFENNEVEDDSEIPLNLLQRKFKKYNPDNYNKMVSFLASKGYKYDVIKNIMQEFKNIES